VEELAHGDALAEQLVPCILDVGDDEERAMSGAGAQVDRARRAGRGQLHDAGLVGAEVGVEPPPQPLVELRGPVEVGDGRGDDLELHVHGVLLVSGGVGA
jgi:hypothetical protein